jgi:hypothetical protein
MMMILIIPNIYMIMKKIETQMQNKIEFINFNQLRVISMMFKIEKI